MKKRLNPNKEYKTVFECNGIDINQRDIVNIEVEAEENGKPTIANVFYQDFSIHSSMYVSFYADGSFKSRANEKMIFSNEREAVRTAIKRFKNKGKNIESLFDYFNHTDFDKKYPELFI